jgi:RNA polymerase sigma-70 factor, ECF subfamily
MMADGASALEEVYRLRHNTFRSALATMVGSYDTAHDIVQEAFARALAKSDQYRGEAPLEAWVWRIALRAALEQRQLPVHVPLNEAFSPDFVEPDRDPALAAAVRNLPARRRLIAFLRFIGDLSYRDIAYICGISEGTVGATLAQVRLTLAQELGYELHSKRANTGDLS